MPSFRSLAFVGLGVALLGILGFLAVQTARSDSGQYYALTADLRKLRELDAAWDVEILRSGLALSSNYDSVTQMFPAIAALTKSISARVEHVDSDDLELGNVLTRDIRELSAKEAEKSNYVEQFKAENAVYRNSLRYVSKAKQQIVSELDGDRAIKEGVARQYRADLDEALSGTLSYAHTLEAATLGGVREVMQRIQEAAIALPPAPHGMTAVYIAHLETLLGKLESSRHLLELMRTTGTSDAMEKLQVDWNHVQQENDQRQVGRRTWLVVYASVLLVLLAALAFRLINSFRLLRSANSRLTESMQDLRSAQARLVQSEKMSALGQMVAGIAHEINTPLAYVRGILEFVGERVQGLGKAGMLSLKLARVMAGDPGAASTTKQICAKALTYFERERNEQTYEQVASFVSDGIHGVDQINEIIVSLRSFSRADAKFVHGVDLRENLNSTLVIAKNILKNKVVIERQYAEIPPITCAPSQINQVFLNIITNASQAISESGTIRIATALHDQEHVRVEVSDTGDGIPPDVLPKIFDPFFTTKRVGEGTGLGLAICFRIVEEHGGRIVVESKAGHGTTFSIVLPIDPESLARSAAPKAQRGEKA